MTNQPTDQPKRVVRLLQISDSHLFGGDNSGRLIGMDTTDSLKRVLKLASEKECVSGRADFDFVLATGDISQDGSLEAYQRFDSLVREEFAKPIYYLPGNHDKAETMGKVAHEGFAPCIIERNGWSIIMLDSTIPGEVPGRLGEGQLAYLETALKKTMGTHVAVCLHHHPIPLGSKWLDGVALLNPDDFFTVLDQFEHVRTVIYGHVHQESEKIRKGIPYYALPSTCIQFKPLSQDFEVDTINPGYRWFEFYDDGSVSTAVHRIENFHFEIDKSITGY